MAKLNLAILLKSDNDYSIDLSSLSPQNQGTYVMNCSKNITAFAAVNSKT